MNLHNIVSGYVGAVNPQMQVSIQMSIGATQNQDGTETPQYAPAINVLAQVQPLTSGDLRHMDALNLQGSHRAMYVAIPIRGAVRASVKGGDLVQLPDNSMWLVTQVMENWFETAGWVKATITLQDGS
jgi:hypothetical protein